MQSIYSMNELYLIIGAGIGGGGGGGGGGGAGAKDSPDSSAASVRHNLE